MPDNYLWPSVGAPVAFLQRPYRPSAQHNFLTWVAYTCIKNEMLRMIITVDIEDIVHLCRHIHFMEAMHVL